MEGNLKFILGWLFVIIITYSVVGWLYSADISKPSLDVGDEPSGWLDFVTNGINWLINGFIAIFRVFFFAIPQMPLAITIVMNIIIQPINIAWFMNIYPFVRDVLTLALEVAKQVVSWIDAIIPF